MKIEDRDPWLDTQVIWAACCFLVLLFGMLTQASPVGRHVIWPGIMGFLALPVWIVGCWAIIIVEELWKKRK